MLHYAIEQRGQPGISRPVQIETDVLVGDQVRYYRNVGDRQGITDQKISSSLSVEVSEDLRNRCAEHLIDPALVRRDLADFRVHEDFVEERSHDLAEQRAGILL